MPRNSLCVSVGTIVNTEDARSRIMDTDYATEIADYARQTMMQQMVATMLVQANTRPNVALSLLG